MQHIPLQLATDGMILAKEVVRPDNPTGAPICGKGVELTASLINRLNIMGIQHVCVEGHPVWQEGDKTADEQVAELHHRFRKVESHPLMNKVKGIFLAQILKSMGMNNE